MNDISNLQRFAMHFGDNELPVGEIDWSRVRVIAWFDPVERASAQKSDVAPMAEMLSRFLGDRTEKVEGARIRSCHLYDIFEQWCASTGEVRWSARGFSRAMMDAGYNKVCSDGMWWLGLRSTSATTDPAASEGTA